MGQSDVMMWLENQRVKGEEFYTITQIQKGIQDMGLGNGAVKNVGGNCYQLCCFGILEVKGVGLWNHKKLFRLNKKYVRKKGKK